MKEIGEAKEIKQYIFHLEGSPIQQARAVRNLLDNQKMNQKEVGELLGWSPQKVMSRLGLLNLRPELQDKAAKGELAKITAYRLSKLSYGDQARFVREGKVTLDEVDRYKRKLFMSSDIMKLLDTPFEKKNGFPEPVKYARVEVLLVDGTRREMILKENEKLQTPDAAAGLTLLDIFYRERKKIEQS